MATYPPPTETLPTFNSTVFTSPLLDALTIAEADARYLKFPIGQGDETISNLDVVGTLTTDDIEPSSASTALDIAGTQVSGALNIGNLAGRTGNISIGTGTTGTGKTITINGLASANTTTINGGIINIAGSGGQTTTISNTGILTLSNGSSSAINIGSNKTGGNIDIGQSGATSSTTTINIGIGSNQTGTISIGNGSSNKDIIIGSVLSTAETTFIRGKTVAINAKVDDGTLNLGQAMTGGSIFLGGTTGGTNTLTINRPFTPAYLPSSANANTMIGYKADIAGLVLATNYPIATGNITTSAFTIPIGVWLVNVVVKVNYASALAGSVYCRLSLSTNSGVAQDARTIDFNPNDNGNNFLNYTTTISASSATSYYLVGASGGTPNPSITSTVINITRIA